MTRPHTDATLSDAAAQKARLEDRIEQTRDALADTIDALGERVDPRQVTSRNVEQARRDARRAADRVQAEASDLADRAHAQAEEVGERLKEVAEERPGQMGAVVAAVVGAALLAWLLRRRA